MSSDEGAASPQVAVDPTPTLAMRALSRLEEEPPLIVITGMSGAGRSTAAKVLEDLGWYVVDNLPTQLLKALQDLRSHGLADSATPFTRRALLTLPANVGGRAISWFTDAVWVGQDEFIARTGQLTFDAACGACPADTLLAGVALMRGTITATGVTLAVIPGTVDITRHAFAENGTSFVVVRNSAALERLPIAGGTSTPIATLPRAGTISGLSCRGTECLVTQYVNRPLPASGLDTWFYRVNLTTNTVTSLRLETGLWTGPVLLATGGDAVLQFSSAGARDLYLFKGLLP